MANLAPKFAASHLNLFRKKFLNKDSYNLHSSKNCIDIDHNSCTIAPL